MEVDVMHMPEPELRKITRIRFHGIDPKVFITLMQVPRCDGCARWAPRQLEVTTHRDTVPVFIDGDVGQCAELGIGTPAGFGCVRWEAK